MKRELDYWAPGAATPSKIVVDISTPTQHGTSWSGFLNIEGLPEPYSVHVCHTDSLGVILSAAEMVPSAVRSLLPSGARVTWREREDLGFPLPSSHNWKLRTADGKSPRTLNVRVHPPEVTGEAWSALVVARDHGRVGEPNNGPGETIEKRVHGPTWTKTLELGAATAASLIEELASNLGGGDLSEERREPTWHAHLGE